MMNCQEALSFLYDIIDKEASEIDKKEVREHLHRCRKCFEVYRLEQAIQDFIDERLSHDGDSPSLDHLRNRVLTRLDEVDGEPTAKGPPRPFRRPAAILVAAAAVVILIGATFLGGQIDDHQETFIPLEQAHWAVDDDPAAYENPSYTSQSLAHAVERLHYELKPAVDGYTLQGGRPEVIQGVNMAHFVYSNDVSTVSVFLAAADALEIPESLKDHMVARHDLSLFDHHCRGCRLVYHTTGSAVVVTATTDESVELLDFIPGHSVL